MMNARYISHKNGTVTDTQTGENAQLRTLLAVMEEVRNTQCPECGWERGEHAPLCPSPATTQLRAQLAQCRALVGIMQRELEYMPPKDHRTEYGHGRADALADSLHGLVAALADLPDAPKEEKV